MSVELGCGLYEKIHKTSWCVSLFKTEIKVFTELTDGIQYMVCQYNQIRCNKLEINCGTYIRHLKIF